MLYDSTLLCKPSILILNKVEDELSQKIAEQIMKNFDERIIPRSIQDMQPLEFPKFQKTLAISAKEKIGLEQVAEVFRSELDRIALEQEIEAGGKMMTVEERREKLRFEMSHGMQWWKFETLKWFFGRVDCGNRENFNLDFRGFLDCFVTLEIEFFDLIGDYQTAFRLMPNSAIAGRHY